MNNGLLFLPVELVFLPTLSLNEEMGSFGQGERASDGG